jgi:hypothetical protein
MIPLGWLPAGLKYLKKAALCSLPLLPAFLAALRSALMWSVIMVSTPNFVFP